MGGKMFLNNLITKLVKRSVVRFGVLVELIHRQNQSYKILNGVMAEAVVIQVKT